MSLAPSRSLWARFQVDPRHPKAAQLRASDTDRDLVTEALAGAYSLGQLDSVEYQERLDRALALKKLGEVEPLIDDLSAAELAKPHGDRTSKFKKAAIFWGILVVLVNLIWLVTLQDGFDYWPMWPMLGTALVTALWLVVDFGDDDQQDSAEE